MDFSLQELKKTGWAKNLLGIRISHHALGVS